MSLATWKEEFYSQPAGDVGVTDAVAHSLKKWRGLAVEHLSRHDVRRATFGSIEGVDERFSINVETCALCQHYWEDVDDYDGSHDCGGCPLAIARGGIPCDDEREDETTSPYQTWVDSGNPKPMIVWLEKAQSADAVDPQGGGTPA